MSCDTFVTKTFTTRHTFAGTVVFMANKTATPWGSATLVEEVSLRQQAAGKRFASIVQLLENEKGDSFVRFAYSTGNTARRGPVTIPVRDLAKLRRALEARPRLAEALAQLGGEA
jgi:hypothetical protein